MRVRTRFAPSPTGVDAHIGSAYTALLNLAFARKNGGQFIFRLEDTDRERLVAGFEENFKKSMNWLGIIWDEGPDVGGNYGPYRQSEKLETYRKYALLLVEKDVAYFCFCSKERLEELRNDQTHRSQPTGYDGLCRRLDPKESRQRWEKGERGVIRLKVPKEGQTKFNDAVRGEVVFGNSQLDDQVLLKSDGYPTYHLAVVVDDHQMEITHVIRAEEWLSSTPKHVLIYQAFGWDLPIFAHTPILRNVDKSKLSKRKNPVWVSWFRDQGYLPEALLNFLALQAWSHPEGKDIFTLEEFIEKVSLERLSKTGPAFDLKKLEWMNGEYLRGTGIMNLELRIKEFYDHKFTQEQVGKAYPLVKERMKKLSDFESLADFLFNPPTDYKNYHFSYLKELLLILEGLNVPWQKEEWEKSLRKLAEEKKVKAGDIFMDLRVAISGSNVGPDLFESIEFLGEEEVLRRVGNLIENHG